MTQTANALLTAISFLQRLGYQVRVLNNLFYLTNPKGQPVSPVGISAQSVITQARFENDVNKQWNALVKANQ